MKKFFIKYENIFIYLIILIISISLAVGALFGYAEINFNLASEYLNSLPPKFGQLEFSDADNLGEYNSENYNSVFATDEAKIMLFSDLHLGYLDDLTSKLGYYEKQDNKIY